ncbi:MAG TPA: SpoIIE family protein phosphatase [Nocardioidaceae bacterium]|nr:SpoIIE family protein phosphatase [Nocardioidaceae bacterium]
MTVTSPLPAGYRAVVAEDDVDIRTLLNTALESWGYDVLSVAQGDEALSAIRELLPDIALLDINMPGLSGPMVIEGMRRDHATKDIPAMLITAETAGPKAQSGLAAGADDYVRKPFHLGELKERVLGLTARGRDLRDLTSLQQAVSLPDAIRSLNGVQAVGVDRPVPGALAGGDFMAVTASPGGQVTAIVGDVEGHGMEAASLAAFARAVLATNAAFTDQPGLLLSLANWTLAQRDHGSEGPRMVTATVVVIDPRSLRVRWASAGQQPPLFFTDADQPASASGLPLGVEAQSYFPMNEKPMAPGERVLLFTDGLMRAALGSSDVTESVLPHVIAASEGLPLADVLDSIVEAFHAPDDTSQQDDLGLLLLEAPSAL